MAATKAVWGIDLGQCALKALALRLAGDKVEVVDHVYIEHEKILSQPDVDRAALVAKTMSTFLASHDLSKDRIAVAVPGQNTLARFTKLPPVDKRRIPEIVKYEAQQQIPFDMDEVIWDYQVFETPDAVETEVGIFAMRRELLREHMGFLSSNNLEPGLVQSAPLALYNALKFDGLFGDSSAVILDIGAQNTDLIVVDGDSLWTRTIPIGGNSFTEALVKTFKLSFRKSEKLKREAQKHKYARQIFQSMRPVFADLVAEVQRSIGFYTSSRRGVKLGKVIAMGNAFQLPGMAKFVQQNLGMEVVRPTSFNKLSVSDAPRAPELIKQLLSFGVAYGLALQALGKAPITSNLLPTEIAKQVVWRKKTPWFYGAAACLLMAGGVIWARNMADSQALAAGGGGKDGSSGGSVSIEEAYAIAKNGPNENLSPKALAEQVQAAAQMLSNAWSEQEGRNQQEVNDLKAVSKLHEHKAVWPKIIELIHGALPAPDPALADALAQGGDAYRKLIESDAEKYKRPRRKLVFIDEFRAQYSEDVQNLFNQIKSGQTGAQPGVGGTGAGGGTLPAVRGFLITLLGRTTYDGAGTDQLTATFLNDTFITNLKKTGAPKSENKPGDAAAAAPPPSAQAEQQEVTIADAFLHRCQSLNKADAGGMGMGAMNIARGPAAGGRDLLGGGMMARSASMEFSGDIDPITGESMTSDYEYEIIVCVPLGKQAGGGAGGGGEPFGGGGFSGPPDRGAY